MTPLEQAIRLLHQAGYHANPSNTMPGYIKVLDPVHLSINGMLHQDGFEPRLVHPSQVHKFISDRS